MRLAIKVTLILLLLSLAGVFVGSFVFFTSARDIMQETIGTHNMHLVRQSLSEIDQDIYEHIGDWELYSKGTVTQVIVSESNKEFEALEDMQKYIDKQEREWTSSAPETITPFMKGLMSTALSARMREKIWLLEESAGYKVYGEVFVTNKYGAVVAMTGKTTDYFQADEEWWQKAKADGISVEDVTFDDSANIYAISLANKITDEEGNFAGVLKAVLNIREVVDHVKGLRAEVLYDEFKITQLELISGDAKLIYSTEFGSVFFDDLPEDEEDQSYHFELIEGKPSSGYQIIQEDPEGEVLLAYTVSKGFKGYKGLGWLLAMERDAVEVFAPIDKLMRVVILSSLVVLVLVLVVGFVSFKLIITDPIEELRDVARKIGSGNLSAEADIDSNDELGQLAREFHKMSVKLRLSKEKQARSARQRRVRPRI
ncbi:MAG: HAMP domain-containing protein [archaeon]|nr:HAMP domain-containing protein [archaeon]